MSVRSWLQSDIPAIAALERTCFQDPWTEQELQMEFSNPYCHCYLVEDGGQVCGYCCLFVLFETAEVHNIAVDLPYRGRGYAKKLMDKMHEKAKTLGAEECLLEVRESNAPAIALYQSYGYEKYGERKRYYSNGETAVLMRKAL